MNLTAASLLPSVTALTFLAEQDPKKRDRKRAKAVVPIQ